MVHLLSHLDIFIIPLRLLQYGTFKGRIVRLLKLVYHEAISFNHMPDYTLHNEVFFMFSILSLLLRNAWALAFFLLRSIYGFPTLLLGDLYALPVSKTFLFLWFVFVLQHLFGISNRLCEHVCVFGPGFLDEVHVACL